MHAPLALRAIWAEAREVELAERLANVLFGTVGTERAEATLVPRTGGEAGVGIDVQV
jgi:hypothetical protein